MNLPNKITLSRIILTLVFMFFLFSPGITAKYLALFTFIVASLTDLLDGYIARKKKLENDFGRLMDPIADKILILSAFLAFVELKIIPAWMVIIIIFRELLITGLRIILATRRVILSASLGGKHKTTSQMVAIISILIFLIIRESAKKYWTEGYELWFKRAAFYLMLLTVVLTIISGLLYLQRHKNLFFAAHEKSD